METSGSEHRHGSDRGGLTDREHQEAAESTGQGPVSPSLKQETLFIFDWDDTILPTTWLQRIQALDMDGRPVPNALSDVQQQMSNLCLVASQTLQLAGMMGALMIITNSAPGWVDQSCQLYMPQIAQQVRNCEIVSKPMYAPLTFKIGAFKRECRRFKNLVSVGDGEFERDATLALQMPPSRKQSGGAGNEVKSPARRIKSVKLIDSPTCQQLIAEHDMLQARLVDVVVFQGSLDLKVRFPPGTCGSMSPAHATRSSLTSPRGNGGCTLVHYARHLPGANNAIMGNQLPSVGKQAGKPAGRAGFHSPTPSFDSSNDANAPNRFREGDKGTIEQASSSVNDRGGPATYAGGIDEQHSNSGNGDAGASPTPPPLPRSSGFPTRAGSPWKGNWTVYHDMGQKRPVLVPGVAVRD